MSVTAPTILYKQPSEIRTYTMDFTNLLGDNTISAIISITNSLRGGGTDETNPLRIDTYAIVENAKKVSFSVGFGGHRKTYRIEVLVRSSDGQILEGDGLLTVADL